MKIAQRAQISFSLVDSLNEGIGPWKTGRSLDAPPTTRNRTTLTPGWTESVRTGSGSLQSAGWERAAADGREEGP